MSFDAKAIARTVSALSDQPFWLPMSGALFGPRSARPLKIELRYVGRDWEKCFQESAAQHRRELPRKDQADFDKISGNPLLLPSHIFLRATRLAINRTPVLSRLGYCGHPLTRSELEGEVPGIVAQVYEWADGRVPDEVRPFYSERDADSRFVIPVDQIPPSFLASDEQVQEMLEMDEFVREIGNLYAGITEEGVERQRAEMGNLPTGSGTPESGPGSPQTSD